MFRFLFIYKRTYMKLIILNLCMEQAFNIANVK